MSNAIYLSKIKPIIHSLPELNAYYSRFGDLIIPMVYDVPQRHKQNVHALNAQQLTWSDAYKVIPDNTIILKSDLVLGSKYKPKIGSNNTYIQQQTEKHFEGREYFKHHKYLFFIKPKNGILKHSSIKNPFSGESLEYWALENEIQKNQEFLDSVSQCKHFINNTGILKSNYLKEDSFYKFITGYFNAFQSIQTDSFVNGQYLQIGDRYIGVFSLSNLNQFSNQPLKKHIRDETITSNKEVETASGDDNFYTATGDTFTLDLPYDHLYNQIILTYDQVKQKRKLESLQGRLYGSSRLSSENKDNHKSITNAIQQLNENDQNKLVYAHNSIIVFAKSESELNAASLSIKTKFQKLNIVPYIPKGNNLKNLFFNSNPAFISKLNKQQYYQNEISLPLSLYAKSTTYNSDPIGIPFQDRLFNIPTLRDDWDDNNIYMEARSFGIFAKTGGGKSVLCNHISRIKLENSFNLVIVDRGDSFTKMLLVFPDISVHIRYREGSPIGINPFDIAGAKLTVEELNHLATICTYLWKRDELPKQEEIVSIKKLIQAYYEEDREGRYFPDFYYWIKENENLTPQLEINNEFFNRDQFLHNCSEFVGRGPYSFIWSKENDVLNKIKDKRFVLIELGGTEDPTLISLLNYLSASIIKEKVWSDRSTKGMVLFDEFGETLKHGNVLLSVEFYFQAIRKQEGQIGIVLQSPTQLPTDGKFGNVSNNIITNMDMQYVLYTSKGYNDIVQRFNYSEYVHDQLKTIKNNYHGSPYSYSEFAMIRGKDLSILRLELSKEIKAIYNTKGPEHTALMELYEQEKDMTKAVKLYTNKE